jgi:hypothetical protein
MSEKKVHRHVDLRAGARDRIRRRARVRLSPTARMARAAKR